MVRILHWTLVASIAAAWLTREGWGRWHEAAGYTALTVVVLRIVWGFAGPRFARFAQFVRPPPIVAGYAIRVLRGRAPRHLGHNPLGGWMVAALILGVALVALSGWLYTTDAYWGVAWVETTHDVLAQSLLVLIGLHVGGVIATSILHRENLAAAMIHGRKRAPEATDVA